MPTVSNDRYYSGLLLNGRERGMRAVINHVANCLIASLKNDWNAHIFLGWLIIMPLQANEWVVLDHF
jgi:hypothetical protein